MVYGPLRGLATALAVIAVADQQPWTPSDPLQVRKAAALNEIVMIRATYPGRPPGEASSDVDGAGILIGRDQQHIFVLTVWHVARVQNRDDAILSVWFHGQSPTAPRRGTFLKSCGQTDLQTGSNRDWAVLTIDRDGASFTDADFEHLRPAANDVIRGGVWVIGNPYGERWGIASGVSPHIEAGGVQFDSAGMAGGFSGGGIFDDDWRLVGLYQENTGNDPSVQTKQTGALISALNLADCGSRLSEDASTGAAATVEEYERRWPYAHKKKTVLPLTQLFPHLPNAGAIEHGFNRDGDKLELKYLDRSIHPCTEVEEERQDLIAKVECHVVRQYESHDTSVRNQCVRLFETYQLSKNNDRWVIDSWRGEFEPVCPRTK